MAVINPSERKQAKCASVISAIISYPFVSLTYCFSFISDMEEDPELRKHVNVYKDSKKMAVDTESEIGEGEFFFLVFFLFFFLHKRQSIIVLFRY